MSLSRNQFDDAMAQFRQAEEIIARLAAADPNDLDMQVNLLRTQRQLGNVSMYRLGDTEGGQRYFRKAVEISRACLAKKPDNDGYKSELANSLGQLAGSEMALGHLEKARELYREEIAVRESFSPAKANDWESRRELAGHYAALATLNVRIGDLVEGQQLYDRSASIREQVAAEKPDFWPAQNDLALSYNNQGSMRFPQGGDPKAAREFHRKALRRVQKTGQGRPAGLRQQAHARTDALLRSDLRPSLRRQRRGRRGFRRMPEDLQRAGDRPHSKAAGRSDARAGPLRRSCRGRQDRRDAGGDTAQGRSHLRPGRLRLCSRRGAARRPAGATRLSFSTTSRGPSIAYARPRTEAGPTSWASRPIPTSNRSATTRHSRPCSREFRQPGGKRP